VSLCWYKGCLTSSSPGSHSNEQENMKQVGNFSLVMVSQCFDAVGELMGKASSL